MEITWKAPEFNYYEKDQKWYWSTIGIALAILAFAVWQKNFLFGFFIVAAESLLISWGNREPETVDFKIDDKGLYIKEKFYPFTQITGFANSELEASDKDYIETYIFFKNNLKFKTEIRWPKTDDEKIRTALRLKLKEYEYTPTWIDIVERILRI